MIKALAARHGELAAAAGHAGTDMTVVFDAGQNSDANFADLAATLARGRTRRPRKEVEEAIRAILKDTWVRRVVRWELTGTEPAELRLTWNVDQAARQQLEDELFGKHVLIADHDHWPVPDVVAAYRSQSEAEFGLRHPFAELRQWATRPPEPSSPPTRTRLLRPSSPSAPDSDDTNPEARAHSAAQERTTGRADERTDLSRIWPLP